MLNFPSGVRYTDDMMSQLRESRRTRSASSSRRPLSQLADDIKETTEFLGIQQARRMGIVMLQDTRPDLFWSGRLQASGFLFVDGQFVRSSGGDINMKKSNHHGVIPPDAPRVSVGPRQHQIDIIWHTPKRVKRGKTYYVWRGRKWFDYAIYKLTTTHFLRMHSIIVKLTQKMMKEMADDAFERSTFKKGSGKRVRFW
jgi:hypothetical protein